MAWLRKLADGRNVVDGDIAGSIGGPAGQASWRDIEGRRREGLDTTGRSCTIGTVHGGTEATRLIPVPEGGMR